MLIQNVELRGEFIMVRTLSTVVVLAMMCGTVDAKTPEEEVLEVARSIIDAANSGDRDRSEELHHWHSRFGAVGGLLYMPRDISELKRVESDGEAENEKSDAKPTRTWRFSHWKHPEINWKTLMFN